MGRGRPEPEVAQDLLDDGGLLNDRDEPHPAATAWTDQGIDLVDLLDEPRPGALGRSVGDFAAFLNGTGRNG